MEFTKYNSLENVKQKFITSLIDQGYGSMKFVATEKIHGSNFGIHIDNTEIKFSRRNAFLEECEQFNGHMRIAGTLIEASHQLRTLLPSANNIIVFGEICGGSLNGKKKEGAKKIQGEVQYSEDTEFLVFDIKVDGEYLPFNEVEYLVGFTRFELVPIVGIGTLTEVLGFANDSDSVVPAMLGYDAPEAGTNFKEGNVIAPYKQTVRLPNGKRLIFKDKNSKFKESKAEKPKTVFEPLSKGAAEALKGLLVLITPQRLDNVISKELDLNSKDFGRIMGLLMQDAIEEYDEEYVTPAKEVAGDDWKRVIKIVQKDAQDLTRSYFIENVF